MDFTTWLKTWLTQHPLKAPETLDRARYTAQVMRTITDEIPLPVPAARWFAWPRLAMAFATTAAGVLIVLLGTAHRTDHRLAQLAPHAPPARALMLAESTSSDEEWIQETTRLLDQLDEDSSTDDANATSDEEWLKELHTLDEDDLGASS